MATTYGNEVTTLQVVHRGTASKFNSMFAPSQAEDTADADIVRYPR